MTLFPTCVDTGCTGRVAVVTLKGWDCKSQGLTHRLHVHQTCSPRGEAGSSVHVFFFACHTQSSHHLRPLYFVSVVSLCFLCEAAGAGT